MTDRCHDGFDDEFGRVLATARREGTTQVEALRRSLEELRARPGYVAWAVNEVLRLAAESRYDSGGRRWTREDLYAERCRRRR